MNALNKLLLTSLGMVLGFGLAACSTPVSQFGVYKQSDGAVGVHAPKDAKESEAQEVALEECNKLGKRTATIVESRKTVNDRFPLTYIYLCRQWRRATSATTSAELAQQPLLDRLIHTHCI